MLCDFLFSKNSTFENFWKFCTKKQKKTYKTEKNSLTFDIIPSPNQRCQGKFKLYRESLPSVRRVESHVLTFKTQKHPKLFTSVLFDAHDKCDVCPCLPSSPPRLRHDLITTILLYVCFCVNRRQPSPRWLNCWKVDPILASPWWTSCSASCTCPATPPAFSCATL